MTIGLIREGKIFMLVKVTPKEEASICKTCAISNSCLSEHFMANRKNRACAEFNNSYAHYKEFKPNETL